MHSSTRADQGPTPATAPAVLLSAATTAATVAPSATPPLAQPSVAIAAAAADDAHSSLNVPLFVETLAHTHTVSQFSAIHTRSNNDRERSVVEAPAASLSFRSTMRRNL